MVAGTTGVPPSANARIVARRILPDRVFGNFLTISTSRNEATAPMRSSFSDKRRKDGVKSKTINLSLGKVRRILRLAAHE